MRIRFFEARMDDPNVSNAERYVELPSSAPAPVWTDRARTVPAPAVTPTS